MRKIFTILMIMVLSLVLISCKGSNGNRLPASQGGNSGESSEVINQVVVASPTRKIIYTVQYSIDCEDTRKQIDEVNKKVQEISGYIGKSEDNEYRCYYEYHIPTKDLNAFLDYIDAFGGVSEKRVSTEDVTTTFNSYAAVIETLNLRKTAYEEMLEKEKDTMSLSEKLEIIDKIDQLNKDIRTNQMALDALNGQIEYSVVNIWFSQTKEVKDNFFAGYANYLYSLVVNLGKVILYALPFVLIGGISLLVVFLVKRKKKQ